MLRIVFAFIMLTHGLIHLLGFVKEWKLAPVAPLTGTTIVPLGPITAKVFGALWLIAFLLFVVATAGFLLNKEWWGIVACVAVVVSQLLIQVYWSDARAGTIANLIILPVIIVSLATWRFDTMVNSEVTQLFAAGASAKSNVLTRESVGHLPPVLVRWLDRSRAIGKEIATSARLKQRGTMRSKPDGSWAPFEAEQYVTFEQPAFIWRATMHMAPLIDIAARDKYIDGHGNMFIKALALITIADSKGPEMDQGTLLRYLAELSWFPTAVLNRAVTWEAIDDSTVRATMSHGGISASGVLLFDSLGDLKAFEAERFGEFEGKFSKELWHVASTAYSEFNGMRVASANEVTWKFKSGDFTWLRLELTDLELNNPKGY